MRIAIVVALGVMGCGKGGGAPATGSAAGSGSTVTASKTPLTMAGSGSAAECNVDLDAGCAKPASDAGTGSGSGSGSAAPAATEDVTSLPETEASDYHVHQRVRAGFGDSPSVFDPTPEILAKLSIAVTDDHDKPYFYKTGFANIAGSAPPPGECEELRVIGSREAWGEVSGARVSLICVNGEDDKTARETAILLAIGGEPTTARVLWAGEADVDNNYMDACMTSHSVKFSVHGKTLTKSISDTVTRGTDAPKDCKKRSKKRSETVELP